MCSNLCQTGVGTEGNTSQAMDHRELQISEIPHSARDDPHLFSCDCDDRLRCTEKSSFTFAPLSFATTSFAAIARMRSAACSTGTPRGWMLEIRLRSASVCPARG